MLTMANRALVLCMVFCSVLASTWACSSDTPPSDDEGSGGSGLGGGGASGDAPPADYTTVDVDWNDEAVILDDLDAIQASLRSADYESGIFVFEETMEGLERLDDGKVTLLAGVGVFEVVAIAAQDSEVALTLKPAPLTEVIDNGVIAWRRDFLSVPADDTLGQGIDFDATDTIRTIKQRATSFDDGNLSYTGKLGDFDTSLEITRTSSGLSFSASTKASVGAALANASISGSMQGLTNEANIEIEAGSLTNFRFLLRDVQGDVEVQAGGVEVGLLDTTLTIPARVSFPILIAGIPFRLDLGASVDWQSTLAANTSALFKGSTEYRGGVGVDVRDGEVNYLATFEQANVNFESAEHVGTVKAGLGIVMNFPEVGFGVGFPAAIGASSQFRFRSEVVSNFELRYETAGTAPVITGNCMRSNVNFGATLGGSVQVLGIELAKEEVTLFSELGPEQKQGNACD